MRRIWRFTYLYLARGMVFLLNIYVFPLSLDKRPKLFDLHTERVHWFPNTHAHAHSCWLNIWILMFSPLMAGTFFLRDGVGWWDPERLICIGRRRTPSLPESWNLKSWLASLAESSLVMSSSFIVLTPLQYQTQVRFGIPFKIPTEYDYIMPRLQENAKIP